MTAPHKFLLGNDPYRKDGLPYEAFRTHTHQPSSICSILTPHLYADCGYSKHPGFDLVASKREGRAVEATRDA